MRSDKSTKYEQCSHSVRINFCSDDAIRRTFQIKPAKKRLTCILHQQEDLNAKIAKDREDRKER